MSKVIILESTIKKGLALLKKYPTILNNHGINNNKRKAFFLGQLAAENENFEPVRESGYYKDIKTARAIFYTPFLGKSDAFVASYLRNSSKMLNYVYANRMGNGNEASGDGFKYRGGGNLQNTGKNMYKWLQEKTGIPFLTSPDLIIKEENSILSALCFWKENNLNYYADKLDIDSVSDLVNKGKLTEKYGDTNHFEKRKDYTNRFLKELNNEK